MSFTEQLASQFKHLLQTSGSSSERAFREQAWEQYSRLGLPSRSSEAWKYSSLNALTRSAWDLAPRTQIVPAAAAALHDQWASKFDVLIVVNGELCGVPPAGVVPLKFDDLRDVEYEDGWIGLSAAVARPGFDLTIAPGVKRVRPLLVIHAMTAEKAWAPSLHRISLGAGAQAEIAEVYLGGRADYMRSEITVARMDRAARLTWVRLQYEDMGANHFSDVQCHLGESADLNMTQINGGAVWSRSTFRADIHGEGAHAHIGGLTFARQQQQCDQRVEVRHRAGNTTSAQLFKGVLKDRARGVLNGKIYIARNAQKVVSSQLNHNLLLSSQAEADTKPELEIYADDVKANHGASIGRLDEDKVFYLMSRGITRRAAQQMLAHAFVTDVLMKIPSAALLQFAQAGVDRILPEFSGDMEAKV